jgi:hypothetical protein
MPNLRLGQLLAVFGWYILLAPLVTAFYIGSAGDLGKVRALSHERATAA